MTREQYAILDHTMHRAARNCYCGNSKTMQELVELGFMRSVGTPGWSPDEYFTITPAGRLAFHTEQVSPEAHP